MISQWRLPARWRLRQVWYAFAALLFVVLATREVAISPDLRGPQWANALCGMGMAVPLLAGRRYPSTAVLVAVAAAMVQTTWLTPSTWLAMPLLGLLLAAFVAGRYAPTRGRAAALLVIGLAEAWAGPFAVNGDPLGDAVFINVAEVAAWLLGRTGLAGERLAREEQARARTEREREAQVRAAVTAAREAVARDLHDTVAHAVTLMVLQATGTRLIARDHPDEAHAALESIEKVGRRAMEDLRAMLHVLRRDGSTHPVAAEALAPAPGVAALATLIAEARGSGLDVTLESRPSDAELPGALGTTVYRVVQEGLTNAARHAPGSRVRVAVRVAGHQLVVTVDNEPPREPRPRPVAGTGAGLLGLRERVAALGGTLDAFTTGDGGFALSAELPRSSS